MARRRRRSGRSSSGTTCGRTYAKLAIEGRAPSFVEGVTKFFEASEKGERKDIEDVDIKKSVVKLDVGGQLALLSTPVGDFKMRRHAFAQLCRDVSAPPGYLVALPPSIALDALSWGVKQQNSLKRTLRVEGDEVRAMVSARYAPLDDRQACRLLYTALKQAGRLDEAQIESWSAGTTSQITVSCGKVIAGIDKGYAVHAVSGAARNGEGFGLRAGITMRNGELGNGSLGILAALWRHWCSNGCLIENIGMMSAWTRRHTGDWREQASDLADVLTEILKTAELVLERAVPGALKDVFKPAELEERLAGLKLTKNERKDVLRGILAEAFGLYSFEPEKLGMANVAAERQAADVIRALEEAKKEDERDAVFAELKLELNGWNVVNAVTAVGRDAENPDRAVELETLGGSLLADYLN
jgi:hypothetical protein